MLNKGNAKSRVEIITIRFKDKTTYQLLKGHWLLNKVLRLESNVNGVFKDIPFLTLNAFDGCRIQNMKKQRFPLFL